MQTNTFIQSRAIQLHCRHCIVGHDADLIKELDNYELSRWDVRRGDEVKFQQVEVTQYIEQVPEYRYGFNGQLIDKVVKTNEKILSEEKMILRQRKGQLVWVEVK